VKKVNGIEYPEVDPCFNTKGSNESETWVDPKWLEYLDKMEKQAALKFELKTKGGIRTGFRVW
jgi:hypothetical protein